MPANDCTSAICYFCGAVTFLGPLPLDFVNRLTGRNCDKQWPQACAVVEVGKAIILHAQHGTLEGAERDVFFVEPRVPKPYSCRRASGTSCPK